MVTHAPVCRFCYMNPDEDMNSCDVPEEVGAVDLWLS